MKRRDVYWETLPAFMVSRVFGVAPFNDKFIFSKTTFAYTVFSLSLTVFFGTYLGLYIEKTNKLFTLSPFSLMLSRSQLLIILIFIVVSTIKSVSNIRRLQDIMKDIKFLDQKLYEMGILVPYSRFYGYALTTVRLSLIMSLFIPDLIVFKSFSNVYFLLVQYVLIWPLLVCNIVQVQFMVLLEIVQRRIRTLSEKLDDISLGQNFIRTHHLYMMVSIQSCLMSICEIINDLYSPQILILLSSIFIVTTTNLYHVIDKLLVFISSRSNTALRFLVMTSYRVMVRSMEVWTLVKTCVNTQDLAQEFNVNLYQVMIDDKGNELSGNKKLRLHVSMKRELVFTAWGFFTLDYTLVHSMIAAATTYLVILIQFGNPTESAPPAPPIATNATTA